MEFSRGDQGRGQKDAIPELVVGIFMIFAGLLMAFGGLVTVRAGYAPALLSWGVVASGLLVASRGLADAWSARRSLRA